MYICISTSCLHCLTCALASRQDVGSEMRGSCKQDAITLAAQLSTKPSSIYVNVLCLYVCIVPNKPNSTSNEANIQKPTAN